MIDLCGCVAGRYAHADAAGAGRHRRGTDGLGVHAVREQLVGQGERLVGDADTALSLSDQLLAHGVYAPAIRPPTVPAGTSRIRMSVTAGHRPEQIDRVLEVLEKIVASDGRLGESLKGGRRAGAEARERKARPPSP